MRYLFSFCILIIYSVSMQAQTKANFTIDSEKRFMCYTERSNGQSLKNTTVDFKNTSTCTGDCYYIWDFGDNSAQQIKTDITKGEHTYTSDGVYDPYLITLDATDIHDSIKNNLTHVIVSETLDDSVDLQITYKNTVGAESVTTQRVAKTEFSKKINPYSLTVFSPVVDGNNFHFEVEDGSNDTSVVPIQSFIHTITVDTSNFKPHDFKYWKYYWEVFTSDPNGEPVKRIDNVVLDSIEYRYIFPQENFDPGYYVRLTIALDSSEFENQSDLTYYDLEGCVYSKSQIIPVTDFYFTEETRKEDNVESRKKQIPNIFTPGGNDENETFFFNTNGVDVFSIAIYNSWGTVVYTQEANSIFWTGKDNSGEDCPSGTYYYVIESNNRDERHTHAGFIHLFRQN